MNVNEWLKQSKEQLSNAGVATARLDCLVLLEDELGKDRAWLLSHPEYELQGSEIEKLNTKIVQRVQHVPLAYLRGHAEFYGREFTVNAHTLVPRPETETIIELLKTTVIPACEPESKNKNWIPDQARDDENKVRILDVGTGSGCIAITAALELPDIAVLASDIDEDCLEIAHHNAKALGASVAFFKSNLVEKTEPADVLLANLPYVPDNFQINTAATHEPRHALFGGPDGLNLYRKLFTQITAASWKPRYILAESLPPQHETLAEIAKAADYHLQETADFIQLFVKQWLMIRSPSHREQRTIRNNQASSSLSPTCTRRPGHSKSP